nr:50S ribosomal protein L31, chloroplastic [Tanacetum cinerariifolium]
MYVGGIDRLSTREVDSDPGNSISMPQILGDASYMEAALYMEAASKKFGGVGSLDQFMHIPALKGEIVIPPKRKPAGKGHKK